MKASIVARGVDSLVIGYSMSGSLKEEDLISLEDTKTIAQIPDLKGECPIELYGCNFVMLAKGTKGYEWILQNDDVSICIAKEWHLGKIMPEIMVTYRAGYLWREGFERATICMNGFVNRLGTICDVKVSRVDLAVDMKEELPSVSLTDRQIQGRMRKKAHYVGSARAIGLKHTGYQLGAGTIVARVYDKVQEVKISKKDWMEKVWEKGGLYEGEPVTRVEFQFRRESLKQFGVNSVESLVATLPDLWHYATHQWFTMHEKNDRDSRHTRWKLSDFWKIVQSAVFVFGERLGVLRSHQIKPRIDHLSSMAKGVLASMVALTTTTGCIMEQAKQQIFAELEEAYNSIEFDGVCKARESRFAVLNA